MPLLFYYIISGIFLGLPAWVLWEKAAKCTGLRKFYWPALFLKVCCGFAIGYFYPASFDTHNYQAEAVKLTGLFWKFPEAYFKVLFYNDLPPAAIVKLTLFKTFSNSFFFVKLLSILNFITGNQYYLNSLLLSFISFAGIWYFVKTVSKVFPGSGLAAVSGFLFFPSVVLWSSGVLKDGVTLASICVFWALVLELVYLPRRKLWLKILLLICSAWLLWKIKYFLAVLVYGFTLIWLLAKWATKNIPFFRSGRNIWFMLPVFALGVVLILSRLHEHFNAAIFFERLMWNYHEMQNLSVGRPTIQFPELQPNFLSLILNTPQAIWSCLFRPYIWEGDNLLYRLAGLENILLFILSIGSLPVFKKSFRFKLPAFYGLLLVYCVLLAAIFAFSTPNLGSLNRYRIAFLPFLVFLLLQTPFWKNVLNRLRKLLPLS